MKNDLTTFIGNCFVTRTSVPGRWNFGAHNARLYKQDDHIRRRIGAWCAKDKKVGHWLQVDLGKIKFVTAVATQGIKNDNVMHNGFSKVTIWFPLLECLNE